MATARFSDWRSGAQVPTRRVLARRNDDHRIRTFPLVARDGIEHQMD
jgi:hypothetical protein